MSTKVVTAPVRIGYANIMQPRLNELSGKEEFSAVVLVPKSDAQTVAALKAAAKAAIEKKFGSTPPKGIKNPLRDGDSPKDDGEPRGDEYAGHWFFNAKSNAEYKPGVVDKTGKTLEARDAVMSGDTVRLSLNAYAYAAPGNTGVGFGILNVMLVDNTNRFGEGRSSAADDFGIVTSAAADFKEPAVAVESDWE